MTPDQEILEELKKINQQLAKQNHSLVDSFLSGFLHTLGIFVSYLIIIFAGLYFASKFNWTQMLSRQFEMIMFQVNWSKIIPVPKINIPIN